MLKDIRVMMYVVGLSPVKKIVASNLSPGAGNVGQLLRAGVRLSKAAVISGDFPM